MADEDFNEWELGSGLALDGADVEVTGMEFGFHVKFPGKVGAAFKFTILETGDEEEQFFTVGDGWEASKDGSQLVTENGRPRKINDSSNFGRLLGSAIELLGGPDTAREIIPTPRRAECWMNTMWTLGTIPVMSTNPTTGETKEHKRYVFTAWRGHSVDAGAEKTTGKASSKAGGAKAGAKTTHAGTKTKTSNGVPEGIEPDMWTQLVDLAKTHDDHEDFMDAAFEISGVEDDKATSRAVMGTKAGSVWAAAGK